MFSENERGSRPSDPLPASLRELTLAGGRVPYGRLERVAKASDVDRFVAFLGCPVLVGSAVRAGSISRMQGLANPSVRKKTLLFKPSKLFEGSDMESESLQQAIYPLTKTGVPSSQKSDVLTIGRMHARDLVMPDTAVSERHARIEVVGGRYHIADLGSTNGTCLNGVRLGQSLRPLSEGDTVTIARYDFTYLTAATLHRLLTASETC